MFQNGQTETKLYIDTAMLKFVRSKKHIKEKHPLMRMFSLYTINNIMRK